MSLDSVRGHLARAAPDLRIIELESSTATVELAAAGHGVEPGRIAKTLSLRAGERAFLIVVRGDARLDNRKMKAAFGGKARMLDAAEVETLTGHPVGGVCPFGLATPLPVYCDMSLRAFDEVVPAAGSTHAAVRIDPVRMAAIAGATWVDVCRDVAGDVGAGIVVADTITKLPPQAAGAVVVSASHGGVYPGYLAAAAGVRAAIFNDAGIGRDAAGIGSLPYLEALGIAAAAVSHLSCRIGDTADMLARGRISHLNAIAREAGIEPGLLCREAAERLRGVPIAERRAPPPVGEGRAEVLAEGGRRRILLLDSAAMVTPADAGHIIVTGSHGGLVGGAPAMALRTDGFAAIFNDAGIGADEAGIGRLAALDARGIAAVTVAAASARIGDARSTYEDGVISRVNDVARGLGAAPGMAARDVLKDWAGLAPRGRAEASRLLE